MIDINDFIIFQYPYNADISAITKYIFKKKTESKNEINIHSSKSLFTFVKNNFFISK